MKQHYSTTGLEKLCILFGKTRQAFYDNTWRQSNDQLQEALVLDMIKPIRAVMPNIGGLKLHVMLKDELRAHKITLGRDGFFALLRKYELLVKRKKRYTRTTDSNHPFKKWADLTGNLTITSTEQLWVSDITYLRTEKGFVYLSLITDAYSKMIVGYHLSQYLRVQGCLIALNKAIGTLTSKKITLVHHSDRGIQYCCTPYITLLQENKILISMTQSGSPYDNAIAERVNGILKTELNLEKIFATYSVAVAAVHQAINTYNQLRPHMSCGNLTPAQAHAEIIPLVKKWKGTKNCKAKSVLL